MDKAAATRLNILQQAFDLIYRNGYQASSIDDILATTKVTKGAFFYHFKNKDQMGLAMVNEVMYPGMKQALITPLITAQDPIQAIYTMMKHVLLQSPFFQVEYGCPAVNLIEEMAPLNEAFHRSLLKLILQWQEAIVNCLREGMTCGKIRPDVNPEGVAVFIMAGYSGIRNMGKLQGKASYHIYLKELKGYLKTLT
jgi:AcrR family transcriptional regulator